RLRLVDDDRALTILHERAEGAGRLADLRRVLIAREDPVHATDRGRQRGDAGLHHRVTEAAQARAFDVRDRAEAHERHVAARHLDAHAAAVDVVFRCARILFAAAGACLYRLE